MMGSRVRMTIHTRDDTAAAFAAIDIEARTLQWRQVAETLREHRRVDTRGEMILPERAHKDHR